MVLVLAVQTASASFRPWALLGYISGFQGQDAIRLQFENRWIREKDNSKESRRNATVEDTLNLVPPLEEHCNSREDINVKLTFVNTGTIRVLEQSNL